MRSRTARLAVTILAFFLLVGSSVTGAATAGPPPGPPPPPPPPPPPEPSPPELPCVLAPLPPELDAVLRVKLAPELLAAARALDAGSWPLPYDGKEFKTYINPERSGFQVLLNFSRLQQGSYIGGMKALVPFQLIDKGQCFPASAARRALDAGSYLLWMADAAILGVKLPPETLLAGIHLNWFIALIRVEISQDEKIDIGDITLIFYPDAKYRSPEEMLKAARSLDDGGILAPLPRQTARG